MIRRRETVALSVALLALPLAAAVAVPTAAAGDRSLPRPVRHDKKVCGTPAPGDAACHARVVTDAADNVTATATPAGYGPADLSSAYQLPTAAPAAGSGPTIAIVDAYDDPKAADDLATYRATYGLPPCPTSSGCFRKVNQSGGTRMPSRNTGWAQEISLDLDMASAVCPNCKLLLVEASTPSIVNLGTAVNTAVRLGANEVSNSYGGNEFSSETNYDFYYNHPGVAVTASSGDNGYGVEYPAASQYVTAVGGTTLTTATPRRESAWSGAGSGCSKYEPKPTWQSDVGCGKRTVADVAAVADPSTGVAVYDTYGGGGWLVFGGTSVASPIIAGVYALAGNANRSLSYTIPSGVNDVTSGSNGSCGPTAYLCTAGPGYDGPTGNGTPHGTAAF